MGGTQPGLLALGSWCTQAHVNLRLRHVLGRRVGGYPPNPRTPSRSRFTTAHGTAAFRPWRRGKEDRSPRRELWRQTSSGMRSSTRTWTSSSVSGAPSIVSFSPKQHLRHRRPPQVAACLQIFLLLSRGRRVICNWRMPGQRAFNSERGCVRVAPAKSCCVVERRAISPRGPRKS